MPMTDGATTMLPIMEPLRPARPDTADTPLKVLHLDEHLVAIDKPAGMMVHRSAIAAPQEHYVLQTLRDQLGQHVYPVHRLDRGTSGVLVMALDRASAHTLTDTFTRHQTAKVYLGFTRGWPAERGHIDHPLSRIEEDLPRVDRGVSAAPQSAVTDWERVGRLEVSSELGPHPTSRYALLQLTPQTGRQHQIRRHLKHISHPLIGDATYGKGPHNRWWAQRLGLARLWLHARWLELPHPATGEPLRLHAPPGPEWQQLCNCPGWTWDDPPAHPAVTAWSPPARALPDTARR